MQAYRPEDIITPAIGEPALGKVRPFEVVHTTNDAKDYLPTLGLFGTAGDPQTIMDWRGEKMPDIQEGLSRRGLDGLADIYNPIKTEWDPSDAVTEARHLARDGALILPVFDYTAGHGSLAETGFAALGGTLRPQRVSMYIESGADIDDNVLRARSLTTMLAKKTLKDFPINADLAPDLDTLVENGIRDIADFVTEDNSRIYTEVRYSVKRKTDLVPRITLVGSGTLDYEDSWYQGMQGRLDDLGVSNDEQYSAYVADWTIDDGITELDHKTGDAVVLFAVTGNENSYGAMGELGWLATYCVMNGQSLGIYVEHHDSDPKSEQNRQRKLAMAHLGRQLLDFPDLPIFVASTPSELALYGASELAKYKQLQKANQIASLGVE